MTFRFNEWLTVKLICLNALSFGAFLFLPNLIVSLPMPDQIFSYQQLFNFTKSIFEKIGCNASDADTATKALLSADIRGIDSHGIARLSGYVRLWEAKRVNAKPNIKIIHETPSTA